MSESADRSRPTKPLPDVAAPLTAPFWRAATDHRLVVQRCDSCGYLRWPPTPLCTDCQTPGGDWVEVEPAGALYSYAEYHRPLAAAFADEVPYVVGLVDLDAGPKMYGRLLGPWSTTDVGSRVRAVFDPVSPDVTMVRWARDDGEPEQDPQV